MVPSVLRRTPTGVGSVTLLNPSRKLSKKYVIEVSQVSRLWHKCCVTCIGLLVWRKVISMCLLILNKMYFKVNVAEGQSEAAATTSKPW